MINIPFNKPYMTGKELFYISQAHHNLHLSGGGPFTWKCHAWLERRIGCSKALLTHSCTAALEMAAMLTDIQPGDEVIMPSYTFVSTANAFVLRGGVPVFVDIRKDTLNIDEAQIEAAITGKTKAIVPVHYSGIACEMDSIMAVAQKHHLCVIEDAAQGMMCSYKGRPLGSIGHMAAVSFHETKNIISGEGGALFVNKTDLNERSEILWEKGTNRSKFFRGEIDKYTWVDIGSSFLPSELIAAFLWAQLEHADELTQKRLAIWNQYHEAFAPLERAGLLRRPVVPDGCRHNAHMYYLLLPDLQLRDRLLVKLNEKGVNAVFHYIPLHSSPAGINYGKSYGELEITEETFKRIIRLPIWVGMETDQILYIISSLFDVLESV